MYLTSISVHPSMDRHFGGFHILAIVNNAAENTRVYIFFQIRVLIFFG